MTGRAPDKSVDTRTRLIRAGVEILDAEGLEAVGLRAITRRAGLSHGAPRRYFPTHQALLAAIARTGIDELFAQIEPILDDESAAPSQRLTRAAERYVQFAHARRAMFELMFRHDLLDGAGESLRAVALPFVQQLNAVVAECTGSESSSTTTTWERTVRLWASLHGLAVLAGNRALDPLAAVADIDADAIVTNMVNAALG